MNELCSVVITTYNRQELLKEAVASVNAQTYEHIELIVVDDGSFPPVGTDSSEAPDYWLIHQPNFGPAIAANVGFVHATGEYFLRMDDDDLLSPHYVELCMEALEDPWCDIAGKGRLTHKIYQENDMDSACVFRSELFWKAGGFQIPTKYGYGLMDWDFWIRCYRELAQSKDISWELSEYEEQGRIWRKEHSRISPAYENDHELRAEMIRDMVRRYDSA